MRPFTDSHCHILPAGIQLGQRDLSAARDLSEVLAALREEAARQPEGWIVAHHYDPNRWGGEELNVRLLEEAAPGRHVLVRHSSGHAGVASASVLALRDVTNVPGGDVQRDVNGVLTGVLYETAWDAAWDAFPEMTRQEMRVAIERGLESMAGYGIGYAADFGCGSFNLEDELWAYHAAESEVERACVLEWASVFGPTGVGPDRARELAGPLLAGIKLFADGAIGARTAALYEPYDASSAPAGLAPEDDRGMLIYPPEELSEKISVAAGAGFRVYVHAIGDRAVDHVLDGFSRTANPSEHRIEHAMVLSDVQIERIAQVGCAVSLQPEFLAHFGRSYARQLGEERASKLIRAKSLRDAGVDISFSSDRPVVPGDPEVGIRMAVTREGFDPSEAVPEDVARDLHAARLPSP